MDDVEIQALSELEENHFWYKTRRDQLEFWVSKNFRSGLILDLGSAAGGNTLHLLNLGYKVVSAEYSTIGIQIQKSKGIDVIQADARDLPFENNTFELVICLDVLEHIKNDKKAMEEVCRVLKRNGRFLFSVPENPKLWSDHDVAVNHFRRYDRTKFQHLIATSGLVIEDIWSTLIFLKFPLRIMRKFTSGSNLKKLSSVMNFSLYLISKFEFYLKLKKMGGVTLWASGSKLK